MANYKPKYATPEQVAVIEQMIADGHQDALMAFGADCVHEQNKALARNCLIAFGVGILLSGAESLIKYAVKKRREMKDQKSDTMS